MYMYSMTKAKAGSRAAIVSIMKQNRYFTTLINVNRNSFLEKPLTLLTYVRDSTAVTNES